MDSQKQTAVKSGDLGRPREKELPSKGTVQITFRLDVDLVRALDAEAERIKRENPGLEVERTEIIRMLLKKSLKRK